jgi:DNA-binding transcriptional regulator PaaX
VIRDQAINSKAHLSRLKTAGLVEPHRSGKRVFYRLSGAGESLLGIFGELA